MYNFPWKTNLHHICRVGLLNFQVTNFNESEESCKRIFSKKNQEEEKKQFIRKEGGREKNKELR